MTSTTERYRAAASQSAGAVEKIADFWTQGAQKLTDRMASGPAAGRPGPGRRALLRVRAADGGHQP